MKHILRFSLFVCVLFAGVSGAVKAQIITTIAGNGSSGFLGEGTPATAAEFNQPHGMYIDAAGNIFIADVFNNRIRKIDPSGIITTVAGNGTPGYITDGVAATSTEINEPYTVIADGAGNVIFTDCHNHRIRKVNTSGVISTIAGTGTPGFFGENIAATLAQLQFPSGLAYDGSGNLIFSDEYNHRVRKIDPSGIITTIAGTGTAGFTFDNVAATTSELNFPCGIHIDPTGNIIITDNTNHRIRKVTPGGIISTIVGNGTPGFFGDNGPATAAEIKFPAGTNYDSHGNLYISDASNNRIRIVSPGGTIYTYTGNGTPAFFGDFGPATAAEVNLPIDVAFSPIGELTIADYNNYRIRRVAPCTFPVVDTIVCATSVCIGATVTATDDSSGGVWSVSNGHASIGSATGIVFGSSAGTDTISYSITNLCGTTTVTKTIVVSALPNPITPSSIGVCPGDSIQVSDATIGGTWSKSATTTITISSTGMVHGVSSGGATISYTNSAGCSATHFVFVFSPPVAISPSSAAICPGTTVQLSDATSGGTWASGTSSVATVGTAGLVTGVGAGTATISYTAGSGSCHALATITVNPQPLDISPPGSPTLCLGSTYALSDATSGGTWSSAVTSVATIGTSGVILTVGPGTDVISYTNGFGCARTKIINVVLGPTAITPPSTSLCVGATTNLSDATGGGVWTSSTTSIATVGTSGLVTGLSAGSATITYTVGICNVFATVTVNALPAVGVITGLSGLCVGSNTSLSDAAGGGVWSSTNTAAATITGLGSVHGVSAGTTTISYTVTGAFCTAAATYTMTINPLPNGGAITGPLHVCNGSNISLSDATASGGTGVWSSSNTSVSTVSSGGIVTGASVGNDVISYTVTTPFNCVATATYPDTVDNAPNPISGTPTVCIGSATILTDVGLGTWSSSNTVVASVAGGVVTGLTVGTTTISYSIGSGASGCSATMVVTVIFSPAAIVPAYSSVCTGSTVSLSDASFGGTWMSSNTLVATVAGGTVTGVGSGTATMTYTIGSCYSIATVTVNNTPLAITPLGAVSLCAGSTFPLSDASGGGAWTSDNTSVATVAGGLVKGVSSGTANIAYTSGAGCAVSKSVTINLAPVPISPTSASVCVGNTTNLSDATGSGIWSSSNTNASVSGGVVTGLISGSSTITYAIGTCISTAAVTINPVPAAITPSGAVSVCAGTSTSLSDISSGGTWSSGNTSLATVSGGTVTGVGVGSVNISYSLGFGCSVFKAITVNTAPSSILPASPAVCAGSAIGLSDAVTGGTWSSSATATATIGTSGVVSGVSGGTTTITYAIGSCSTTTTLTVIALPVAGSITGPSTVCMGASISLTDASGGGVWSSSNTSVATVGGTGTVNGLTSGTSTISYTVTNSCGTARTTATVSVNSSPSAGGILGSSSVCAGTFTTLSDAVTGGTWSASNGNATIGGGGLLTGVSPGIDTIIYTVTTPCGTASTTKTVSVGAFLTAGSISGATSLCAGTTIPLSDPASGGVWSSSNTSATVSGLGVVTGVKGGVDTISYTVSSSCGSAIAMHTVTVNPLAVAGTVTGPALVCAGTVNLFSDAAGGGVWTVTNTKASITGTGLLTAITPGTDTVVYSVTNGCGTVKATEVITIGSFLSAGTITGLSSVCQGSSIALSDVFTGGVWTSVNTAVAVVGTSGTVTGINGGVDTISYTVTAACGSASTTHTVAVIPLPNAGSITGPSAVCLGSTIMLSDAAAGGVWSASNGHATITSGGLVTPVTTGTDTMTYRVTNACGTAAAMQVITVGTALTAGTITGPTSVCQGSSISLSDAAPGGVWSSVNTGVAIVGTSGIVTGTGAGVDTIRYTFTNVCGSAVATATVNVNPLAVAGSISGPGGLCLTGGPVTYTDAAPGGAWSISNGNATISGGVVTPVSVGADTISYSVTNGCGTVSATKVISINTAPVAGTIAGPSGVCLGSSITLSDAVSGGFWSSNNTAIATVGTTGIVSGVAVGKDAISYTVSNSCGTAVTSVTVSVDLTPTAGTIIGPAGICAGTFTIYTDGAPGGIWSVSNSAATITSLGGVVNAITPLTLDTIIYTVTNGCGTAIATKPISIGIFFSAGTITGPTVVCTGVPSALTDATGGGVWASSNTHATITGGGIVTGITPGTDTISYTITASCGVASTTTTLTINPSPNAGTITGSSSVCVGSIVALTDAVSGGTWSSGNVNATVTTGGIVTGIFPGADTISYTVTNSCGVAAATKIMTINPVASAPPITGPGSVCVGASIALSDATGGGIWTSVNTAVATVGTSGVVTGVNAATDIISYTVVTACGISTVTTTITVNPLPDPGVITGTDTVCIGSTVTLADAVPAGVWSAGNGHATVIGGIVTGISLGTDPISYTVTNGCGSASAIAVVDVSTTPVSGVISGPSSVCVGSGITLIDPVPGGTWLTSNGFAVVVSPGIIDGVTVGTDSVFYQVTNACGTSVASKIISVNPVPVVGPITGAEECTGTTALFNDGVGGGVWTSSNLSIATIGISSGVVTGVAPGTSTITYTVTNIFGCPTSVTYVDTVVATPVIPAITGSTNACVGSATMLSDAFGGGTWTSSNTTIATIDPVTGVLTGMSTGIATITYSVVNICGSASVTGSETVNPSPVVAGISGSSNVCVGATTMLSDITPAGAWSSVDTTIAKVDAISGLVTGIAAGSVNILYTVTNGFGCSTTVALPETVNPAPVVAAITGATHECAGNSILLIDTTPAGAWSSSNTAVATAGSAGTVTGLSAGNVMIMYTVTGAFGCTTTVMSPDTVIALPLVAGITGSLNACVGATTTLSDLTPGGAWSSSNTAIATIDPASGMVTGVSSGADIIAYSVTNLWGCVNTVSVSIAVNPIPVVAPITGYSTVCAGQTISLTDATAGGAWSSTNTAIATVSGTGLVTTVSAGTASIIYTVTGVGGCTNVSGVSITVSAPMPAATIMPGGSVTLCHGAPQYLHVVTSGGGSVTYQWLYNGAVITGATNSGYTTNTAGRFSVMISNGICNETIVATTVVGPPDPVIFFTLPDILYTGSFANYQWFLNGVLIPGATSSTLKESSGGLYTVVVTDANGCTDTSLVYRVNAGGTAGVNGVANNTDIRVYPNPATSTLHIDAAQKVNVSIYSIDGKMLLTQKDATNLDISSLANGMYMVLIYDENNLLLKSTKFAKVE